MTTSPILLHVGPDDIAEWREAHPELAEGVFEPHHIEAYGTVPADAKVAVTDGAAAHPLYFTALASLHVRPDAATVTDGAQAIPAGTYSTVALPTIDADTAAGWDPTTSEWVAPATGPYVATATVRYSDAALVSGTNVGVGVGTSNADSALVTCSTAGATRNTYVHSRTVRFTVGDRVRLFTFQDGAADATVLHASLGLTLSARA